MFLRFGYNVVTKQQTPEVKKHVSNQGKPCLEKKNTSRQSKKQKPKLIKIAYEQMSLLKTA
jgi:hypothetical protein